MKNEAELASYGKCNFDSKKQHALLLTSNCECFMAMLSSLHVVKYASLNKLFIQSEGLVCYSALAGM